MALLAKDATPNHRLRAARGRMTQEQEAEALCNLAGTKGQHPGINAKMVSNWERGIQNTQQGEPRPAHRVLWALGRGART